MKNKIKRDIVGIAGQVAAEKLHCAKEDTRKNTRDVQHRKYKENKFETENVKREKSVNSWINEKGLFSISVDS